MKRAVSATLPPAPPASSAGSKAVMLANRGSETAPEIALRSILHRSGLRFRKHVAPLPGLRCQADVVFTRAKVVVFVDGCFWHRCPLHATFPKANAAWWRAKLEQNFERDRRNDKALTRAGWTVVRVWEHEDPDAAAGRIEALLRQRRRDRAAI
ncbi:MAG TPA: very short patch repair endonuclease [Solirubrobacterales bacterium]|nr:very short patch repair endonuclease [Solirubrobacterales bacterium]